MSKMVKVGDTVQWRGGFGTHTPQPAVVKAMEVTDYPREKYGREASEVTENQIKLGLVVFTLDNGHWAYSSQIDL